MEKSSFTRINGFQDNIAQGRPNQWRCRAGARYLYICEDGLVHYCSQQRGYPGIPSGEVHTEDIRREYVSEKSCAPQLHGLLRAPGVGLRFLASSAAGRAGRAWVGSDSVGAGLPESIGKVVPSRIPRGWPTPADSSSLSLLGMTKRRASLCRWLFGLGCRRQQAVQAEVHCGFAIVIGPAIGQPDECVCDGDLLSAEDLNGVAEF